jgi:hypothetical protein
MSRPHHFMRATAIATAAALAIGSLPVGSARAGLVATEQVVAERAAAGERERLTALFERDDVRGQLEALGVDRDEAVARIAGLSDSEVLAISGRLDALPAGQGVIEGILVAAGIVFIVLIITDLLGVTDLFPFINSIR